MLNPNWMIESPPLCLFLKWSPQKPFVPGCGDLQRCYRSREPQRLRSIQLRGFHLENAASIYGGFRKWRYPNSWMDYNGKSHL